MRNILLLTVTLALALAGLAYAQIERDPASRHNTSVEEERGTQSSSTAPEGEAAPADALRDAAQRISAGIVLRAQAIVPSAPAESLEPPAPIPPKQLDTPVTVAEAEAAPPASPGKVVVETSAPLLDDPDAVPAQAAPETIPEQAPLAEPATATEDIEGEEAPAQASELAALAQEKAAELDAPAPADADGETDADAAEEPAPAQQTTTAANTQAAAGRRLVPDRRQAAQESLLSRDGGSEQVQRSQPSTPTGSTSLAQITGETASTQPALTGGGRALSATPGLAAAAVSARAPVTLQLPDGDPRMPGYDVPASLKVFTRGNPKEKLVALTFDDGPHPEFTSQLLAVLDYYDVPATFFCVGVQAQKYPQWVKMINQQGHEVANHTYDHFRLPKLPKSEKEYQIDESQRLIESLTGVTPRFLRPPGGQDDTETEQMLSQRKMVMAMWDVAINDTSHGKLEQDLLDVSLRKVRPGSILLAHDGIQATIDMLPQLIEKLRANGYRFVTLSELAAEL